MRRKIGRRGSEEGSVAVETTIVLAVLLALMFGIIEFGTTFFQWNTMVLAVEEAGRFIMLNNGCNTPTCGENRLQTALTNLGYSTPPICSVTMGSIVPPTAGSICVYATKTTGTPPAPDTITLTAVYAYDNIIVPSGLLVGSLSGPFTVTGQATFPLD
jgi:Flp pilus assembly protein TadG